MSVATITEAQVHSELWRSFASLLKAYAAAASLNGAEHRAEDYGNIEDLDEEDFQVHTASRKLYLQYHIPTQRGGWSVIGDNLDQSGHFELTGDGNLILEGAVLDLDHGAIELIAKLTKPAGASR